LTSLTNQAYGREIGFETVFAINRIATGDILPTHIIFLDVPLKIGLERTFDEKGDKFESMGMDFYNKVRDGYDFLSKHELFTHNFLRIDGTGTPDEVFTNIIRALKV